MRQPKLIAVTGMKGVGKSVKTLTDLLTKYSKKRKILLIDVNDEYGNFNTGKEIIKIKKIGLNDITRFSTHPIIEPRRIVFQNSDGSYMDFQQKEEAVCQTIERSRNGALVIEDMSTVFGDSLPVRISGLLCNNRQRNADVFLHLQSVGRILPKMFQNINLFRIHKQLDAIEQSENKLGAEYEIFKIAYTIVENEYKKGNVYYSVYVDRDSAKIKGAFTKNQASHAVEQYISTNQKCLRNLLNKKDKQGKLIYDYPTAVSIKEKELQQKYF